MKIEKFAKKDLETMLVGYALCIAEECTVKEVLANMETVRSNFNSESVCVRTEKVNNRLKRHLESGSVSVFALNHPMECFEFEEEGMIIIVRRGEWPRTFVYLKGVKNAQA